MILMNYKDESFEIPDDEILKSLFNENEQRFISFQALSKKVQRDIYRYYLKYIGYTEPDVYDFYFLMYISCNNKFIFATEGAMTEQGRNEIVKGKIFVTNPSFLRIV